MKRALEVLGWLLALALFAFAGRAVLAAPAARDAAGELTEWEASAARELAVRFLERLRASDDFAPLVGEMFVADFGERLRRAPREIPTIFVAPEVLARADPETLRRFYAAEFNYLSLLLQYQSLRDQELEESGREEEDDLPVEKIFPPPVLSALRREPIFLKLVAMDESEKACRRAAQERPGEAVAECQGDTDDILLKSLEELRDAAAGAERVAAALRRYVPTLPRLREKQREWVAEKHCQEVRDPHLETFEEERYGFPPGTRFARALVEPVHDLRLDLLMVEEAGAMRLVWAFPVLEN